MLSPREDLSVRITSRRTSQGGVPVGLADRWQSAAAALKCGRCKTEAVSGGIGWLTLQCATAAQKHVNSKESTKSQMNKMVLSYMFPFTCRLVQVPDAGDEQQRRGHQQMCWRHPGASCLCLHHQGHDVTLLFHMAQITSALSKSGCTAKLRKFEIFKSRSEALHSTRRRLPVTSSCHSSIAFTSSRVSLSADSTESSLLPPCARFGFRV